MNKTKIDVIYNIGVEFGGVGTGYTAYNAVKWGAYKHNSLKKLLCRTNKSKDIPKNKTISFPWLRYLMLPFRAAQMIFKWDWICPFPYVDPIYGYLASKNVSKCDIYHGWCGYSLMGIKRAKKLGAITIVECASPHPRSKLLSDEFKKYHKEFQVDEKIIKRNEVELAAADYILIPSDFVEKSFLEKGYDKNRLIKIPFGVDLKNFSTTKNKNDNKFRVIFVGSVQLRKGIQYLLKAWDELKLKNAELLVVGRIWPDAQEVCKNYFDNPTIKFLGFDSNPKKYYEKSDVFVFPSIEEGSALVSYEAMASGLPLIVTPNTGSVMRDGKEGFIIPIRNVNKLKEKIKYMYNHPEIVKKMGKNARKLVEQYSWEKYGENLFKEYLRILDERKNK